LEPSFYWGFRPAERFVTLQKRLIFIQFNFENQLTEWLQPQSKPRLFLKNKTIENVSKMLINRRISTTQHCAKTVDKKVEEDMRVLEGKLRFG
jgi:hypothetical protein